LAFENLRIENDFNVNVEVPEYLNITVISRVHQKKLGIMN
jgi:hypothetical protein